jgi:nicotinic acid mononucleotide adenylyltransferase
VPDRIGVLGSLCNPPHVGHAALARSAAAQLGLARVLLVPTGAPSHRPAPGEDAAVRLRLAEAAAADEPVLEASRVEVDRPGPSYMADTLLALAPLGPGDHETIAMEPVDVSSSEVRRRVAAGEPIDGLVTPSVAALIRAEGLYR